VAELLGDKDVVTAQDSALELPEIAGIFVIRRYFAPASRILSHYAAHKSVAQG